jgi:outer membrane lipoprotein carrier protein
MGAAVEIAILQPMTFSSDPGASWLVPILLAVIALVPALGLGGTPPDQLSKYVRLFEARYRAARTLQATFFEEYKDNGQTVRTEAGTAYFRRPGKMRWEYESPEKNIFLVDGKTAWFYVPGDHTVMRVPAKESSDWRTPLALLAGEMKVSRVCARVDFADKEKPEDEATVVLRCRVRGAASDRGTSVTNDAAAPKGGHDDGGHDDIVLFEIGRQTGELSRLVIRQGGGVQVEFRFAKWQMNPPVPEAMFHFQVPVGVAIVNGELPAGEPGVK